MSRNRTAAHVTYGGVADTIPTDGTTCDEQVLYFLREKTAIGDLEIAARGWQDEDSIAVDKFRIDADGILESPLLAHIGFGHVIGCIDLARVANTYSHAEIA